jgi:hypothetical protein
MQQREPFASNRNIIKAHTVSGAGALFVGGSPFFNARRGHLIGLAALHAIPANSPVRTLYIARYRALPEDGDEKRVSSGGVNGIKIPRAWPFAARRFRQRALDRLL